MTRRSDSSLEARPDSRLDSKKLLDDLKKLLPRVEADLLARSTDAEVPEIGDRLRAEYDRARAAKRTAASFGEWQQDRITQAAVAWVLSCVFVRFLEDNDLVSPPRIAGPGDRLSVARDSHQHFFTSHPRETDRDYLLTIFGDLAVLPGTADIFGMHNALREIPGWLSGDAAKEILSFFQRIDASTGLLVHDFSDSSWDSRFLGDLYQDLSSFARERYALLQTPHFVEQFLLDRTLDPALAEFAATGTELQSFKMIDPACGSGHLVLGAFGRILDRWQRLEPATPARELVRRTLENVHGVDINPFAVAIARFRLLLVAMRACGVAKLADAPAFHLNVECGDSLLHTPLASGHQELFDKGSKKDADEECEHAYASEDLAAVKAMLKPRQYHAVMANPPYIVVRDGELNARYRKRFSTCHRQYSLAVPFMEQIYRLCVPGGFTGQITANSFMKREFGSKLIEQFFPRVDLTHVIDTSGAYIPGHGTPTVILFGRQQAPVAITVRAVMGIRGEPTTPADPAKGLVWTAITTQVDQPGSQSDFVSVADTPRTTFHGHPWSIGGGGASDLKQRLEDQGHLTLSKAPCEIGTGAVTREDQVYMIGRDACLRRRIPADMVRPLVEGEVVRDWGLADSEEAIWPYDHTTLAAKPHASITNGLWPWRAPLSDRVAFGLSQLARGLHWFEYSMFFANRARTPLSIAFAEVATHNHFVLDRGGNVFKQTAPVIKLPAEATEDDHLSLQGILNSSTACFWMKQVCHNKGAGGGTRVDAGKSTMGDDPWECHFAYSGTRLESFPLPASRPLDLARSLQTAADTQSTLAPAAVIARWAAAAAVSPSSASSAAPAPTPADAASLSTVLAAAAAEWQATRCQQIALQEELDWQSYSLYGLLPEPLTFPKAPPPIPLGERAFEIVLARRVAAGETTTTWFERHGSTPLQEIPAHWPADYRALVQKRLDAIRDLQNIRLIEQPEYKRRWNAEPWADRQETALREFLLERIERLFDFDGRMNESGSPTAVFEPALVSLGDVATAARRDPLFVEAAEVFTGDVAFDALALVKWLVEAESVPLLPSLRYKPSGLRKHADWQSVWEQQRAEDAIDARSSLDPKHPKYLSPEQAKAEKAAKVGDIPIPPKYASADFLKADYWRLRGKLDVPKERFVSFPGVTGPDGTPLVAWAGLDHLQLARAIGNCFGLVQTEYGGTDDPRLVPLLANLSELLPWVKQWHPEPHPDFGAPPAEFFEQFVRSEAESRGLTRDQIRGWTPPAATKAKRAAKKAAKRAHDEQTATENGALARD
jgi:hypothetical protein